MFSKFKHILKTGVRYKKTPFDISKNPYYDPFASSSIRGEKPRTKIGGKHMVTIIPGYGIGKEVSFSLIELLESIKCPLEFWLCQDINSESDFQELLLTIQRNGVGIKGNIEKRTIQAVGGGDEAEESLNMRLRRELDLYVNVMEFKTMPALLKKTKLKNNFDIVLVRANTEGEYATYEHSPVPQMIEHLRVYTKFNSSRVSKYAFQYAVQNNRKKVTCVHHAQWMPLAENMMINEFLEVAKMYPDIKHDIIEFETAVKKLILNPQELDVLIMNSLRADLFASICFGILGSKGIVAGQNIGPRYAIFEAAARNKAPSITGKGVANPTAMFMCGAHLLMELGEFKYGNAIKEAIMSIYSDSNILTPELGGSLSTKQFTKEVINRINIKNE